MKKLLTIALLIFFTGCNEFAEDNSESAALRISGLENGTYYGTFNRVGPTVKYATANVTLVFNNGEFSGTSDHIKFPAICPGRYAVQGNEVEFIETCYWTAEFDWSLILAGKWEILEEDGELQLICRFEDYYDIYRLKLQPAGS